MSRLSEGLGAAAAAGIRQWVRLTGRRIARRDAAWLGCPMGPRRRIGADFYHYLADREHLRIQPSPDAGLRPDFDVLRGERFDPAQVRPEIRDFYRVYHSQRYVGNNLVFRLRHALSPDALAELNERFRDLLDGRADQTTGPLKAENGEFPDLPRLVLPFHRSSFSRVRQVIDLINR